MKKYIKVVNLLIILSLLIGTSRIPRTYAMENTVNPEQKVKSSDASMELTSSDGRYSYQLNEDKSTVTLTKYHPIEEDKEVLLPKKIDGYTVTAYNSLIFSQEEQDDKLLASNIEKIIVPGNYKEVVIFYDCPNVKEIVYKEGVKKIYSNGYTGSLPSLEKVVLPKSITHIGTSFAFCKRLKEINLPSNLKGSIDLKYTKIKKVKLPKGVTSARFDACKKMKEVILPKNMKKLENDMFCLNSKLKKVVLPEKITEISEGAFDVCLSLEQIDLPDTVDSINADAFRNCCSLKEIDLSSVEEIKASAFYRCKKIKEVDIKELKVLGDESFRECTNLEEVVIPGSVRKSKDIKHNSWDEENIGSSADIGKGAFMDCTSLKKVVIKGGVRTIGKDAFNGCKSLRNITIPKSVKKIAKNAIPKNNGKTVIYGERNSWVEKYAKRNGYTFKQAQIR